MLDKLRTNISRWRKAIELSPHLDDLYAAFEEREKEGALSRPERELLENSLAFSATTADEVGMPRADIVAIPEDASFATVVKAFQESYHSRLPVMGRDLDDIKGLISLKDVVALVNHESDFSMDKLVRPVTFVPESMTLQRVLHVIKRTRMPLVMVSDEFGGTSGLITLKDILEELVGNIEDEHEDGGRTAAMVSMGGGKFKVQGDYALEDLDRQLGTKLADAFEDVETIGGALLREANNVPAKGDSFQLTDKLLATVTASDGRRVLVVELKIG